MKYCISIAIPFVLTASLLTAGIAHAGERPVNPNPSYYASAESAAPSAPRPYMLPSRDYYPPARMEMASYTPVSEYCREFTRTVRVNGRHEPQVYGKACRQPDGLWKMVD